MYAAQKLFGNDWDNLTCAEQIAAIAYHDSVTENVEEIEDFLRKGDFQVYDSCCDKDSAMREYLECMGVSNDDLNDDSFDVEKFAQDWNINVYKIDYQNEVISFNGLVIFNA